MAKRAPTRCGDCAYFVRDGKCRFMESPAGAEDRAFKHAPFWIWSDTYADRESVRANVDQRCPAFTQQAA